MPGQGVAQSRHRRYLLRERQGTESTARSHHHTLSHCGRLSDGVLRSILAQLQAGPPRAMLKRYSGWGGEMDESLEARVARQFSSLYLTLVSVLVGLVLSDLFSAIHDRMTLWPLTLETGRTWCQIFGNTLAVLSSW